MTTSPAPATVSVVELTVTAADRSTHRRLYTSMTTAANHGLVHAERWLSNHTGTLVDLAPVPVDNPDRVRRWSAGGHTVEIAEWHVHDGTEVDG